MHHQRERALGDPLQQRVAEIARFAHRPRPLSPESACKILRPGAVVVYKFFKILRLANAPDQQMVEHGVMQQHNSGFGHGAFIDLRVQAIVPDMVKVAMS